MTKLTNQDIKKVIEDKYLSYAISTIISRSLPDVRDGLKPVHRRIIYSMYELNLFPENPFKKCARIVGDVMGKFHPHGDQAIYDSLVRMAQEFSIRYPLIEGQGNFGNVDGDNAAAMRYTEARLDSNAKHLLDGLDQDAVDFIDNYDGQNKEPLILPSLLPNILLNGSSGIAVGMATNIPPHNVIEICNATIELIRNKNISNNKLLKIIKGPDFPTGGEIVLDKENLLNIYNKGRGNFIIKSKWKKIQLSQGQYYIEIYEIPYQVNKNRIIENIANLIKNKKIPIDDVWDESDKEIRIRIKPNNRNIEAKDLMDLLFKHTDLSIKYHCNLNVLVNGKIPQLLGLKEILLKFIEHRVLVIKRISRFKIDKINNKLEILKGFLIVYNNLDRIIKIIRNSKDPKKELTKKFKLKPIQINSILEMKLRSLRKIEEENVRNEINDLKKELKYLNKLIKNKSELDKYMIYQFTNYLDKTNNNNLSRKTKVFVEDIIEKNETNFEQFEKIENVTFVCSSKDNLKLYKGHVSSDLISFNNNEKLKLFLHIKSNDLIFIFTSDGKLYSINSNILPGGKSNGINLSFLVNINNFSKIIGIYKYHKDFNCLLISKNSKGFIYDNIENSKINKNGKQIFKLKKDDSVIKSVFPLKELIATVSSTSKLLIFETKDIPKLKKSGGVILQKIKNGNLSDAQTLNKEESLIWSIGKQIREESKINFWLGKRAQTGKKIPKRFNKDLKFNYN